MLPAGKRAGGQPTCRRMPPFQWGELDLHFICHSRAKASGSAGALEAECQPLQPPHCTLALYGLGAGPLKGFAEQQQGLSPSFAGNLHLCDQFSLRRMLSSYSFHLRGEGYSYFLHRRKGIGSSSEEFFPSPTVIFIHQVCAMR